MAKHAIIVKVTKGKSGPEIALEKIPAVPGKGNCFSWDDSRQIEISLDNTKLPEVLEVHLSHTHGNPRKYFSDYCSYPYVIRPKPKGCNVVMKDGLGLKRRHEPSRCGDPKSPEHALVIEFDHPGFSPTDKHVDFHVEC